jgi:1,4-alpha-glucan branching enzyme
MTKPVNFICRAPDARRVCVTGEFNGWDPLAHPMTRQPDGAWFIQIQLRHGHHQYVFLVDDEPTLDPRALGIARNHNNERVSLLAVS